MGIEKFNQWLKDTYYDSNLDYIPQRCYDHVYVDLNFLLHRLVATVKDENMLLQKVFTSIDHILIDTPPLKSITLVSDGSASYAKIFLQRKRRIMISQSKKFNPSELGALHFSPGTIFMLKFEDEIKKYVQRKAIKNINYIISLSSEPDESEIKICRYVIQNNNKYPLDSHLIISNDADIVVITSSLILVNNIYILIQKDRGAGNYVISIDKIMDHHMTIYGYNLCKKLDFAFISLLNGNDYFPKLSYTNFNTLWKAYKKSLLPHESIMNLDGTIDVSQLKKYLSHLIHTIPNQFVKHMKLKFLNWKDIQIYLDGLAWCMTLYSTGKCVKYDYMCHDRMIHPLALLYYLEIHKLNKIVSPISDCPPINDIVYAVIIMPKKAKKLVLPQYHKIIDTKLGHLYEEELCKTCHKLKEEYMTLMRDSICFDKKDPAKGEIKKQISSKLKKLNQHKKSHNIDDPVKYINNLLKIII